MYAFLQLPAILARGHTPTQDFPTLGTSIITKHISPTPTGRNLLSQRNQKPKTQLRSAHPTTTPPTVSQNTTAAISSNKLGFQISSKNGTKKKPRKKIKFNPMNRYVRSDSDHDAIYVEEKQEEKRLQRSRRSSRCAREARKRAVFVRLSSFLAKGFLHRVTRC
jgi:hypothetical protein